MRVNGIINARHGNIPLLNGLCHHADEAFEIIRAPCTAYTKPALMLRHHHSVVIILCDSIDRRPVRCDEPLET
jgi:hypothetical protein